MQQPIIKERTDAAKRIDGASKMPAVVNEWICSAASAVSDVVISDRYQDAFNTYGFFLWPNCKALRRFRPVSRLTGFSSEDIVYSKPGPYKGSWVQGVRTSGVRCSILFIWPNCG